VLGEHVKQAGSLVSPQRLRFDFSHYAQLSAQEVEQIEQIANAQVLANAKVDAYETSKDEATAAGAIAFFGDKYGEIVRVLKAGASVELCGGTHVSATGDIGLIKIVQESSIGSNLRRIEAVTGLNSVEYVSTLLNQVNVASEMLSTNSEALIETLARKIAEVKELGDEIKSLRSASARARAGEMVSKNKDGVVVERIDGLAPADLRELAIAVRLNPAIKAVVLGGITPSGGVALVAATGAGVKTPAGELIAQAAKKVGGGGGGKGDIATAGGKIVEALDEALKLSMLAAAEIV
jgi:alanyl-tRNA synthetase